VSQIISLRSLDFPRIAKSKDLTPIDAMIRDRAAWERWEAGYLANEPVDFQRNQAIFWALWAEAVQLGVFPGDDLLEGLEVDIRVARALNRV
jgi:hypothetical protein